MIPFVKKSSESVKTLIFLFCILHAADHGVFARMLFWKPVTSDDLPLSWFDLNPKSFDRPKGSSLLNENHLQQRFGGNILSKSPWTNLGDRNRSFKRAEGDPCYMPAVTSTNIPNSVTVTVESIKSKIAAETSVRLPSRRLPTNCYNYDLDAAGVMIVSRISQYYSLLRWFQLIRQRYGTNTGSIVWTTNSTFDSITHCLNEMQDECMCDDSSITPNSYIINNCMIAPPNPDEPNQAAFMLNSLDEFTFILESVGYYVSQMKRDPPEGVPLCSNSS